MTSHRTVKKKKKNKTEKQKWEGGEIWELLALSPHYKGDENDFITREAGMTENRSTDITVGDVYVLLHTKCTKGMIPPQRPHEDGFFLHNYRGIFVC